MSSDSEHLGQVLLQGGNVAPKCRCILRVGLERMHVRPRASELHLGRPQPLLQLRSRNRTLLESEFTTLFR